MDTHSSILAWKIPRTEEPGGLQSKGSQRVRHHWPSNNIGIWELDHKEGWAPKNWCLRIVVPEKPLENPLDNKEIKPDNPKGNQPWIFIRRTKAEAPILWSPDAKNWFNGEDPDAGKDWKQKKKGTTEDGWVASLTRWTWVWASSGSWWWTGKPGVLQSMGLQRVGHSWATELNWSE